MQYNNRLHEITGFTITPFTLCNLDLSPFTSRSLSHKKDATRISVLQESVA